MKTAALLLAIAGAVAYAATPAEPVITYTKYFKGSTPETVIVTVTSDGHVVYKEGENDDNPIDFMLRASDAQDIFALADKLGHFNRPLESGLKVAHMGIKTFRYQAGTEQHEVKFNYSIDPDGQQLADWFERICESERRYIELDNTAHFDKLGVNEALLNLQAAWERKRLVGLEQFLPLLDRIAKNESYLHMARERAAALADTFRKPPPVAQ